MVIGQLYQRHITYSLRTRKLEKGTVATMYTVNFMQKASYALVPVRKAMMDAILLGSFIAIILTFTSVAFTYPWLIIIIYGLVYLIALVLRQGKAVYDATGTLNQEQTLEEANETLASEKTRVGLMLFWGNHPR